MNGGHDLGGRQGLAQLMLGRKAKSRYSTRNGSVESLRSHWLQACWVSGALMNHVMPASVKILRTIWGTATMKIGW